MSKAEMIQAIIGYAVRAATVAQKSIDTADLFFSLAFTTDEDLAALCEELQAA